MPELGTNTLSAEEQIAQRSGFNTGNVLKVLGAGLLGGAGPAGPNRNHAALLFGLLFHRPRPV